MFTACDTHDTGHKEFSDSDDQPNTSSRCGYLTTGQVDITETFSCFYSSKRTRVEHLTEQTLSCIAIHRHECLSIATPGKRQSRDCLVIIV